MDAGNGWLHAARTERDAKLLLQDGKFRGPGRMSRRQRAVVLGLVAAVLVGWGVWALVAG